MEDTEELKVSEEPDEQMDNEYECEQNNQQSEQGQAKVAYGMTIQGAQMVQEVPAGALTIPVKMDSRIVMALVGVTSRVMEEALSGVALEVLAQDQTHIQVAAVCSKPAISRMRVKHNLLFSSMRTK